MHLTDYHYFAKSGPLPFDAQMDTDFQVAAQANGASLTVTQNGFPGSPEADDYFAACQQGWENTFAGIRQFLASSP